MRGEWGGYEKVLRSEENGLITKESGIVIAALSLLGRWVVFIGKVF
jgi:hypothetical protein